ncbi:hypothetical protein Afil01_13500 [Actinorhabdospora filicis]|uniref:DoxX family protein n=1 Tax=Actinorhabdospora filicis TaxID=1785913 RepID=A0A9W6SIC6_9ACTN|nr:DoxX family protein [Actinorhabdospora filicis]GLZ76543.1 hypothetical protein Afil01_13500 [Actinorhabdospora filicis]
MNTALWVGQIALSLLALSGLAKLLLPKEKLRPMMGWVDDFPAWAVKLIGLSYILAAIGLIVPPLADVATWLTPLAATGIALEMIGAAVVHVRRREFPLIGTNVVLFLIAVFVAWGRFGDWSF